MDKDNNQNSSTPYYNEIMTFEEVCKYLGICRNTLTSMMNSGEINFCKLRTHYRFRRSDIMALFENNNRVGVS